MDGNLDNIKHEIAQLREVIASRGGDMATIDGDRLAGVVKDLVDKEVKAKLEQIEKERPMRRGEAIGPNGAIYEPVIKGGKFDGKLTDDAIFTDWILRRAAKLSPTGIRAPSKELENIVAKALTSTGSATGDEYVPTNMAPRLWEDMNLAARVGQAIPRTQMPTDPFDLPVGFGDPTWRKGTQNTATTASDPATAKSTLTSTEQVVEIDWSYDLDEDAVIAVLPAVRQLILRTGGEQIDKFLMNADATATSTGNINLDDSTPASDAYYLSAGQDGIRHLYLADATGQSTDINSTIEDAEMRAGIGRLGKYAADVGGLVMFTDPETYVTGLLALTNVVTVDKFGPQATVLTGELGKYSGIPVIVTSSIAEAEDDGKVSNTAGNNDEGQIAILHRDMWTYGFRRELMLEMYRDVQKRQLVMVASFRIAVACRGTRASATHTAGIHGITRS